jgi:hypothetical protein
MPVLKILWGEDPDPNEAAPETYTFPTKAECDAFIFGASESLGYQDFKVVKDAP